MGIFNLFSSNPDSLNEQEKITSQLFSKIISNYKNGNDITEDVKIVAYRLYVHTCRRSRKKELSIQELNGMNLILNYSSSGKHIAYIKGFNQTITTILDNSSIQNQGYIGQSTIDQTILSVLKTSTLRAKNEL